MIAVKATLPQPPLKGDKWLVVKAALPQPPLKKGNNF